MIKVNSVQVMTALNPESNYLLLINPERIPHLVAVVAGKYYSLTNRKAVIGEDFKAYFNFLKRSNRKVLFLELDVAAGKIEEAFRQYEKVESEKITCLKPIKVWLNAEDSIEFVFELIPFLQKQNVIIKASHIHMEDCLDNLGNFKLSQYSKEDIYSYIDSLNKKYV